MNINTKKKNVQRRCCDDKTNEQKNGSFSIVCFVHQLLTDQIQKQKFGSTFFHSQFS